MAESPAPPPANTIIGSITCTPNGARIGESVFVEIKDLQGQTWPETDGLYIWINGVLGASQYLQWSRPGDKVVFVTAKRAGGTFETASVRLKITPAEHAQVSPVLHVLRTAHQPTLVTFSLGPPSRPPIVIKPVKPAPQTVHAPVDIQPLKVATKTGPAQAAPLDRRAVRLAARGKASLVTEAATPLAHHWNFGNGKIDTSMRATITHDFAASLDPNRPRSTFHVTLSHRREDGTAVESKRTVSFVNPYYFAKQRGSIQPPTTNSPNAVFWKNAFYCSASVRNLEPQELRFTTRRVQPIFEDSARHARLLPVEKVDIRIGPKQTAAIKFSIPEGQIPRDAVGFSVYFGGPGIARGTAVRAATHYDIPDRRGKHKLASAAISQILDKLAGDHLTQHSNVVSLPEIEQLARHGLVSLPAKGPVLQRLSNLTAKPDLGMKVMDKKVDLIREGDECEPENLPPPSQIPDNLYCQATSEVRWQVMPGRFMNARKGDIILSPSGDSLISDLLLAVDPPQFHSHSGIMSRNYDQITHSTASQDRLMDYPVGSILGDPQPTDGFRPDVLKFQWPGVITQTVENAIHGEEFTDPDLSPKAENNKHITYTVAGFDPDKTQIFDMGVASDVIFPLVVKPDPELETDEVRAKLEAIGEFAASQTGKSHYRFFSYTDPTSTDKAPASAGWAKNTYPTVCSSFVWTCVKTSGASFEGGTLETSDKIQSAGGELSPNAKDGLYLYRADERLAAGKLLSEKLHQLVRDTAEQQSGTLGDIGIFFADMGDDVANQILNTFATDWADTAAKDSEKWKDTSDANAVSPDNIKLWDSPALNGLYGHNEPLVYRPPRYEQVVVSKWRKVTTKGTLTGTVLSDGHPVSDVSLQLYAGKVSHSDTAGKFEFKDAPEGSYILKASKVDQDGVHHSADLPVTIVAAKKTDVVLNLKMPDDMYRAVSIDCSLLVIDHEFAAAADPRTFKESIKTARVGPYHTHEQLTFAAIADNDVRGEAVIDVDWNLDKSVRISLVGKYYDGTDVHDDLSYVASPKVFNVNPGGTGSWHLKIDSGDIVDIQIVVKNELQQT